MIEAISGISALMPTAFSVDATSSLDASEPSGNFASVLDAQLTQVNDNIGQAESAMQQIASGQPVEMHDVMISLEKARISVQALIQIRNRVLDVYQDLTRMQI